MYEVSSGISKISRVLRGSQLLWHGGAERIVSEPSNSLEHCLRLRLTVSADGRAEPKDTDAELSTNVGSDWHVSQSAHQLEGAFKPSSLWRWFVCLFVGSS